MNRLQCRLCVALSLSAIILAAAVLPATGQWNTTPELPRFSLWKEVARHNIVAQFLNDFDSSLVKFSFGEFRVDGARDTQFIFMQMSRKEFFGMRKNDYPVVRGTSMPGPDRALGLLARTQPFVYEKAAEMVFFRRVCCDVKARQIPPSAFEGRHVKSWLDYWSVAKPNDVVDTTELVLELVDESTGVRIAILDSVGVYAVPDKAVLERYGTFPEIAVRRVQLPSSHAGRRVFVRPLPYRRGPSEFGLLLHKYGGEANAACLYWDEHLTPKTNLPRYYRDDKWYSTGKCAADTFRLALAQAHLQKIAEENEAGGCIESFFADITLPTEYAALVTAMEETRVRAKSALKCHENARADTAWILSTLLPEPNTKEGMVGAKAPTANFSLRSAGGAVYATLTGTKSARNRFVAYDVTGAEIFRGTFPSAPFENIEIPLPESVKGNVFVQCVIADGSEVSGLVARVF